MGGAGGGGQRECVWQEWVVGWLGVVIAAALCYVFYTGLFCSDDTRYLVGVKKVVAGEYIDLSSIAERRLIFLLPSALAYYGSGGGLSAAIGIYGLFFVLLPLSLYWGFRKRIGFWAAVSGSIVALTPLLYLNAGSVLPDIFSAFIVLLTGVVTVALVNNQAVLQPSRHILLMAAGALAALGVSIKESNAVIAVLPFVLVSLGWCWKHQFKAMFADCCVMLGGSVAFFVLEGVLYRLFAGVWHSSLMNRAGDHGFARFIETQGLYPWDRFKYLAGVFDGWTLGLFVAALLAVLYWLVAVVAKLHLRTSSRTWFVAAVFFLWPLIYFTIGTSRFDQYLPPVIQARYFAPCVPFAALLVTLLLRELFDGASCRVKAVLVASLLVTMGASVHSSYQERSIQYWARAKDALLIGISDVKGMNVRNIVIGENVINSEVGRCYRHMLQDEFGLVMIREADDLPDLPFVVFGATLQGLKARDTALAVKIGANVDSGKWKVALVGYYYADESGGRDFWWLPRERAIIAEQKRGRASFRALSVPDANQPWMKREMHAEIFEVSAAEDGK